MMTTWINEVLAPSLAQPFQHDLLPDGIYRVWLAMGADLEAQVWRVFTCEGQKRMTGYRLHRHPLRKGSKRRSRKAPHTGVFLQSPQGVTLLAGIGAGQGLATVVFDYGMGGIPGRWLGRGLTAGRPADMRLTMEAVAPQWQALREAVAQVGPMDQAEAPKADAAWLLG